MRIEIRLIVRDLRYQSTPLYPSKRTNVLMFKNIKKMKPHILESPLRYIDCILCVYVLKTKQISMFVWAAVSVAGYRSHGLITGAIVVSGRRKCLESYSVDVSLLLSLVSHTGTRVLCA